MMNTKSWNLKETLTAFMYLFPFLLVFGVFLGYPLLYSIWISLHKVTLSTNLFDVFGDMSFAGLDNYWAIMQDFEFWWSLVVTLLYMLITIPLGIFVSLLLAVALNEKLKGLYFFRTSYFLPHVLDLLVIGLIWKMLYSPNGLFDQILGALGADFFHDTGFLGNPKTALLAVGIMMVIKSAGFGMVLFLTALQNISQNIYEAADIDGLTWLQKFRHITIPLVKPVILFLAVGGTMASLNAFTEFYIMTEGNPVTAIMGHTVGVTKITGYYLYSKFSAMNYGYSAAMSYFLLAFALLISWVNYLVLREKQE